MSLNQRIETWLQQTRSAFEHGSHATQRPFVTLCFAQSLDGSLALRAGETLRLSGAGSTKLTHQLRSLHDGILVGIGTVLADDPQLTVREWNGRHPQPIVLDSQLRLPASARVCTASGKRCWVLTSQKMTANGIDCELLQVADNGSGQVALPSALQVLRQRGIRSLMVEGGASVLTAFLQARLVDALVLTIAPHVLGGYKAVGELGLANDNPLPRLAPLHSDQLGNDLIVWGALDFTAGSA
ncbi:MAG TPA: RibD family protein [Candidatus Acidoferrum sp.]|nr:RibD family protein [Candidatus Acidoferrum sp.]